MAFRRLRLDPKMLLRLLEELGDGAEIRIDGDVIPKGAGLGPVTYDPITRSIDIDVVYHRWNQAPDDMEVRYCTRVNDAGESSDSWSVLKPLTIRE